MVQTFFFCCRLCSALLCVDMSSSRYLPISLGQLGTWATCRHPKRGNSNLHSMYRQSTLLVSSSSVSFTDQREIPRNGRRGECAFSQVTHLNSSLFPLGGISSHPIPSHPILFPFCADPDPPSCSEATQVLMPDCPPPPPPGRPVRQSGSQAVRLQSSRN